MKMNEQMILNMVAPYVVESFITFDQFFQLFDMLPRTEQYDVISILAAHNISLRDSEDDGSMGYTAELTMDNSIFGGNDPMDSVRVRKNIASMSNEQLAKAAQGGNKDAMEMLFVLNKNLVWKYALRYNGFYGNTLAVEDLESAGKLGFLKAVERFNYDMGFAFTTYAVWWIRQAIFREINNNGFTIRVPVHVQEKVIRVMRMEGDLIKEGLSFHDRVAAIVEALKDTRTPMCEEKVLECIQLRQLMNCSSLDMPVGEDGDYVLGDLIAADTKDNPEVQVDQICMRSDVMEALNTLTPREKAVLSRRFGLDGMGGRTLEEIANEYGVTRERIRQIEAKALRKLRHPSRSRKLKAWLEAA